MTDFLIYTGLGVLLLGAVYGIYVALMGLKEQNNGSIRWSSLFYFHFGAQSPKMRKLTRNWAVIMIAGAILTAIGIAVGLK